MSVIRPEIDLPRNQLISGGNDVWDSIQAGVVLLDDYFPAAQPVQLAGNNAAQTNTATNGGVSQTYLLAGNSAAQTNTATQGAIAQTHVLAGNNAAQVNTSPPGGIVQTHVLAGAGAAQENTATAGAVSSQAQILAGANVWQGATSSVGAVTVGGIELVLGGDSCAQPNTSTTGEVSQLHQLDGSNCVAINEVLLALGRICGPTVKFNRIECMPVPEWCCQCGGETTAFYKGLDDDVLMRLFNDGRIVQPSLITRVELAYRGGSINSVDNPNLFQTEGDGIRLRLGESNIPVGVHQMRLIVSGADKPGGVVWSDHLTVGVLSAQ